MYTIWRFSATTILLSFSGLYSASINLDSLINRGLKNNLDLQLSQQETEMAVQDTVTAKLWTNPQLSLDVMHNIENPDKPKMGIKLSQEFHPGLVNGKMQVFKANIFSKQAIQKTRELNLKQEIRCHYFTWQILFRKKAMQKEVTIRWEKLSQITMAKMAEGKISQVEETQAQLNLAKAKQSEMEIQYAMTVIENKLAYLIGDKQALDSMALQTIDSLPEIPALDSLNIWMMEANPDLLILEQGIQLKKAEVDLEKNIGKPSFNLSLGYERETEGANLIGGAIEFPLTLFNHNQAGIAKSNGQWRSTELQKKALARKLQLELIQAHSQLSYLKNKIQNYQGNILAFSQKQMSLSEKGFRQGLLGIFDLSKVQEDALTQAMDALSVQAEFYAQWNLLGRMVGGKSW